MFRRNPPKPSLYPKKDDTMLDKVVELWNEYCGYVYIILIILAMILFVVLCYMFIAPLESGGWYNHALNGGV
ncbi:MAG: hypothetical protein HUJ68_02900 [Clostridia bacterium]|nr:hypothetical protein [Clostridia bacterium]